MNTSLKDLTFVVFDTETTGLEASTDRLVEVAALAFRLDGTVLAQFQTLIAQYKPIPAEVTAIHGITAEMCAGAPPESIAITALYTLLCDYWPNVVHVAHNCLFDIGFVANAMERLALPLPPVPVLDSIEVARALWPYSKLQTIAQRQKIDPGSSHRALADCRTVMGFLLPVLQKCDPEDTLAEVPGALLYGWDGQVYGRKATEEAVLSG